MNVPGDKHLSNEEIVTFIDVTAADVLPGWVPSEHYTTDSMVLAWRQAEEGSDDLLRLLTENKIMATMVMAGKELLDEYHSQEISFSQMVNSKIGAEFNAPLATFMLMRTDVIAKHVLEWGEPEAQLTMFQMDSFLLGWLLAKRTDA